MSPALSRPGHAGIAAPYGSPCFPGGVPPALPAPAPRSLALRLPALHLPGFALRRGVLPALRPPLLRAPVFRAPATPPSAPAPRSPLLFALSFTLPAELAASRLSDSAPGGSLRPFPGVSTPRSAPKSLTFRTSSPFCGRYCLYFHKPVSFSPAHTVCAPVERFQTAHFRRIFSKTLPEFRRLSDEKSAFPRLFPFCSSQLNTLKLHI